MKSLSDLLSLKGKVVLVVGGAGYLGNSICETMAELGANVAIASRNKEKCDSLATELTEKFSGKHIGIQADILDIESIKACLDTVKKEFGKLDVLINNAWSGKKNSFESISFGDWDYDINMCLNAVFYTTKEAFPLLKETKGVIINTASVYGHVAPDYRIYDGIQFTNPPSYGAAKAGVIQLTKYLASFLSPHGIRVNAVSPGSFPFPETLKNEKFKENLCGKTMLGRTGVPEDLKGAFALLSSDASKYMTGQNICVDGGWAAW
ncbi:SDR family NAD(P)-dependent oxidoreductase [Mucilaginibacter sp. OK098]|uniref:SDR family NAD(P)-dependent oxidoreductase n=1 Tax=Mucilaginibacter sp. OK098 TaxID=1855297 RepID=UPI0009207F14|nr:SDR family oxidoreductase [Mucilaginibacter sp. OK098]SHL93135.1 Enoyl-(Acyl carrier protein) reductase [Mucilaginibacter sp. OK098]